MKDKIILPIKNSLQLISNKICVGISIYNILMWFYDGKFFKAT